MRTSFLHNSSRILIATCLLPATFLLAACGDKERLGPAISGTYEGPATVLKYNSDGQNIGTTRSSNQDVTIKELSSSSVEVSGNNFATFTITGLTKAEDQWSSLSSPENTFSYSGNVKIRPLTIHWTSTTPTGEKQTLTFGGGRKRKK